MSFEHYSSVFSDQAGGFELGTEWGKVVPETLFSL